MAPPPTRGWCSTPAPTSAPASQLEDHDARGQAVVDALQETARDSQAAALKELAAEGVAHQSFWVSNRILVQDVDSALTARLAALPGVEPDHPDHRARAGGAGRRHRRGRRSTPSSGASPPSTPTTSGRSTATAARAWSWPTSTPACSSTTRRWRAGTAAGRPRRGRPRLQLVRPEPHLLGRRLAAVRQQRPRHAHDGHDGRRRRRATRSASRRAPGWIAAKGCETNSCSDADLLASGQWTLAPDRHRRARTRTSRSGRTSSTTRGAATTASADRPLVRRDRPGLDGRRPVRRVLQRQRRARLRHRRLAGRHRCTPTGSANFTSTGAIAVDLEPRSRCRRRRCARTSRHPAANVRSSVPGGGYASYTGTSMAAPHVAGRGRAAVVARAGPGR